jgi:hypothetical protein
VLSLGSAPASATSAAWAQQGSKLTATGMIGDGGLGSSVSFSADGNTALVGSAQDNSGAGAAYVFVRSNGVWTQQAKLTGGSSEIRGTFGAFFGYSVSLSADGNTALIGGYGDNNLVGAAWVFVRSDGVWGQQGAKLIADATEIGCGYGSCTHTGSFGSSVAISSDGSTVLIGSVSDNGGDGAAWVFKLAGGDWTQTGAKLTPFDSLGAAGFGGYAYGVALSADGNTALIGGRYDHSNIGAAWVFTNSGSGWTQQGSKLTGTSEIGGGIFGSNVALSADGNTAIVGGLGDNGYVGAAWVFTRSNGVWTQQGPKLTSYYTGEVGNGDFGSVAISSNGNTALIGGSADGGNGENGAAWIYTRSDGVWTQQGSKMTPSDEVGGGYFGADVALSADGTNALIGGYNDNGIGAAWVFTTAAAIAPDVRIDSHPTDPSTSSNASFDFSSTDGSATFVCSLDAATYVVCASPDNLSGLAVGSHTFGVESTDSGTGLTSSRASFTWTVAAPPINPPTPTPTVTLASHPDSSTSQDTAVFTFTSGDVNATFLCSLDAGAFATCTSPEDYSGLANGGHSFGVEATDSGQTSDFASYSWTISPATMHAKTPVLISGPHFSGVLRQGRMLYVSIGRWQGATITYRVAWYRCDLHGHACRRINTRQMLNDKWVIRPLKTHSYRLAAADRDKRLYVVVTATNAGGSKSARTAMTHAISGLR